MDNACPDNPPEPLQREDFTIFDIEEALLEHSLLVLSDATATADVLRAELQIMTSGYQRLFREIQRLIKMSDRKEEMLNRLNRELSSLTAQLEYQATHDSLTGILNKRALTHHIDQRLQHQAFGLILFDIDFFKSVNDQYGHPAGDDVLKGFAERIRQHLSSDMIFARIGGEEFAILAPNQPLTQLNAYTERLRHAIAEQAFPTCAGSIPLTASFGVSLRRENESFSSVFTRADTALYQAKAEGRNRVVSTAPPTD